MRILAGDGDGEEMVVDEDFAQAGARLEVDFVTGHDERQQRCS